MLFNSLVEKAIVAIAMIITIVMSAMFGNSGTVGDDPGVLEELGVGVLEDPGTTAVTEIVVSWWSIRLAFAPAAG